VIRHRDFYLFVAGEFYMHAKKDVFLPRVIVSLPKCSLIFLMMSSFTFGSTWETLLLSTYHWMVEMVLSGSARLAVHRS